MTDRVIALAVETAKALAHASYRESCYQTVLCHKLRQNGYRVESEVNIVYRLPPPDSFIFGHGRADIICTDPDGETFILELKANCRVARQQHLGQVARYQQHWRSPSTALLIYFNGWCRDILTFQLDPHSCL